MVRAEATGNAQKERDGNDRNTRNAPGGTARDKIRRISPFSFSMSYFLHNMFQNGLFIA